MVGKIDETDLRGEIEWYYRERAREVIANFEKRKAKAQYVLSRKEALAVIMEMIPEGAVVGHGDSVTLEQIGVIEALKKRNQNRLILPMDRNPDGTFVLPDPEDRRRLQREIFFSDVFLTGANAITLDGKLVSTDGLGNRVAATIFGPRKVIVAAGVNKIVKDVNEALERVRHVAGPINAKRHLEKHHFKEWIDLPCIQTGKCSDCDHEWRICNNTIIIEGTFARVKGRINLVLIGEQLGI